MPNRKPGFEDSEGLFYRLMERTRRRLAPGCWEWMGSRSKNGYGMIGLHGKLYFVHRVSWQLQHGPIPVNVLHRCDNPPCWNPDHLFLGDQADNMQDCSRKGRLNSACGDQANKSLTAVDVLEIRRRYGWGGWTLTALSDFYGVSIPNVAAIIHRRIWSHLPAEVLSECRNEPVPAEDEVLLRYLAQCLCQGQMAGPRLVLDMARCEHPDWFDSWSAKGVADRMLCYGLVSVPNRSHNKPQLYSSTTIADLRTIQERYRLNLGL